MRRLGMRFTVRRLMAAVLGLGVFLGLSIPAARLGFDGGTGYHQHPDGRLHRVDFWARYWRKVLGRSWPGDYVCTQQGGGSFRDVEIPHPGLRGRIRGR